MLFLHKANAVLAEFGAEIGVSDLVLEEGSGAEIEFDSEVVVHLAADPDRGLLVLEASMGPWPEASPELLRLLLKNNYPWTDGAVTFGIQPDTDELVQFITLGEAELTADRLRSAVVALAGGVEAWTRLLSDVPADAGTESGPAKAMRV